MCFNGGPTKQVQKVFFNRELKKPTKRSLVFNWNIVSQILSQNHLVIIRDFKLTFEDHLNTALHKVNKIIYPGLTPKLQNLLPRTTAITIDKSFVWSHGDYYDQVFNNPFQKNWKTGQYDICLALTGATRGGQRKKYSKNWVWIPFEIGVGAEEFAFLIWFWKISMLNMFFCLDSCQTHIILDKKSAKDPPS